MLADDKWVRVMCDYSADGLWAKDGCSVGPEELPVSDALKARLRAWQDAYETFEGFETYMHAPVLRDSDECRYFAAEGLAIAKAIKQELPDWTVIYFDESRVRRRTEQPRTEFEYEIEP
jgi:hypothetical protein